MDPNNHPAVTRTELDGDSLSFINSAGDDLSLMFWEFRHRMKNNLQTIQSLLRVARARTSNQETKQQLSQIEMHLAALSGVNGELLLASNSEIVPLNGYLGRLVRRLKTFFDAGENVTLSLRLEHVMVSTAMASYLGLLVNEAITNSYKYAIPYGATEIAIDLHVRGAKLILVMSDNGPGIASRADARVGGRELMRRLAKRLGASLELDRDWHGTRYILEMPAPIKAPQIRLV